MDSNEELRNLLRAADLETKHKSKSNFFDVNLSNEYMTSSTIASKSINEYKMVLYFLLMYTVLYIYYFILKLCKKIRKSEKLMKI
jgi:hypothetical protein